MPELPTGTVTFLFTDIEGSTRLLHELGERYADVLAEHRRLLRETFARHGGVEVDTQGDAFFYAFARASDAVAAAEEAQRALADASNSLLQGAVAVRIGLHTGEPTLTEEGYVGVDVHRAARIMSAAHGGQVLVSEQTAHLLDGLLLRDLGPHRLKDLGPPARLYQAGEGEFPPPRTLNQTNLPVQPTPLVGREREVAEIGALLDDARVVTLTGAGGSGKTRLALQVAAELVERFPDGVWWVPLQAIRDPELVLPAVAQTLGARDGVAEHIADRRLLLLLDNLEQVIAAAPDLGELLAATPSMHLLVTSRAPLRISGERRYAVDPLPEDDAVTLFVERARAVDPTFDAGPEVAEICRRLDGLPLAIELAAARVNLLAPGALLTRLTRALPLLTGGTRDAPERQRTLRATIEWSYDLLSPAEQRLFERLSVFAGSFTVDAAEAVCDAELDALEALVENSLVRRWGSGRLGLLETVHEFAGERLDEAADVRRRHAEHFLAVAESANLAEDSDGEQRHDVAIVEQHNIRAALEWALEHGEIELGLRLAVALESFWVTSNPAEGIHWFESLLPLADGVDATLRARALRAHGGCVYLLADYDRGTELYEQSLALFRSLGDEPGVARLLHRIAVEERRRGNTAEAGALVEESLELARKHGLVKLEGQALMLVAILVYREGNRQRGIELLEESAAKTAEAGFRWWHCITLQQLSKWALDAGDVDHGEARARQSLALSREMADRLHTAYGLALLTWAAAARGQCDRAGRLFGALDAEEARGGLGHQWTESRRGWVDAAILGCRTPEFERARAEGQRLTLDEAVEEALAEA